MKTTNFQPDLTTTTNIPSSAGAHYYHVMNPQDVKEKAFEFALRLQNACNIGLGNQRPEKTAKHVIAEAKLIEEYLTSK